MQASEVAELLALASAYDNRHVTKEAAVGWKIAIDSEIPDLDVGMAREVIVSHFATSGEYFAVKHLIDGAKARLRRMPSQIAADVRSAKARGLVLMTWDPRTPLTADVAAKLAEARTGDRDAAPELEATTDRTTLALDVGKRVPRE